MSGTYYVYSCIAEEVENYLVAIVTAIVVHSQKQVQLSYAMQHTLYCEEMPMQWMSVKQLQVSY